MALAWIFPLCIYITELQQSSSALYAMQMNLLQQSFKEL